MKEERDHSEATMTHSCGDVARTKVSNQNLGQPIKFFCNRCRVFFTDEHPPRGGGFSIVFGKKES